MEQKHNSEQQPIDTTSSSHNAKPHVVCSPFYFRAWDESEEFMLFYEPHSDEEYEPSWVQYVFAKCKVMQSIGLYDRNNTLIYEGDIVLYSDRNVTDRKYIVPELKYCFVANAIGYELEERLNPSCIVIGNIYQNPELAKGFW